MSKSMRVSAEKVSIEEEDCAFCGFVLLDMESLETGICQECRDQIHNDSLSAWEWKGERVCQGDGCLSVLQPGDGNYCLECQRKAD